MLFWNANVQASGFQEEQKELNVGELQPTGADGLTLPPLENGRAPQPAQEAVTCDSLKAGLYV